MKSHHPPEYYVKELQKLEALSMEQLTIFEEEINEILAGLNKGLAILEKVGKKPEKKVLENQKTLQDLIQKIATRLKEIKSKKG